jgi:hypothetical protein
MSDVVVLQTPSSQSRGDPSAGMGVASPPADNASSFLDSFNMVSVPPIEQKFPSRLHFHHTCIPPLLHYKKLHLHCIVRTRMLIHSCVILQDAFSPPANLGAGYRANNDSSFRPASPPSMPPEPEPPKPVVTSPPPPPPVVQPAPELEVSTPDTKEEASTEPDWAGLA